jgi:hypothetical protein
MASLTASTSQVRIVARIRPVLGSEIEKDIVVSTEGNSITMPNPKNEKEIFTFPFNAVYDMDSDQAQMFSEGEAG